MILTDSPFMRKALIEESNEDTEITVSDDK